MPLPELYTRDLADVDWMRSRRTIDQPSKYNCVEFGVIGEDGAVALRNSNDPGGPYVCFTAAKWRAFGEGWLGAGFALVAC